MNKRRQAAIAALTLVAIISILELPAEARRRYGGYRSRSNFHAERSSGRRGSRQRTAARQPYYRPVSLLAQIDRSGASARETPRREAPRTRRSAPQGDDRFPIAAEPRRRSPNLSMPVESSVTPSKANSLRNYAQNQPYYAMRKLLGKPTRQTEDAEIYDIKGTGNQYQVSRRLVVFYQKDWKCDFKCVTTTSWHEE